MLRLRQRLPRPDFWVILAYTLLTLIMTWPLASRLTTHIPGSQVDEFAFLWNPWWARHALLTLHTNPLYSDWIFYPIGVNLASYSMQWGGTLLSLPLQPLVGLVAANNLVLLSSFVIGAYGTYRLALYLLTSQPQEAGRDTHSTVIRLAAFAAGVIFAFAPSRFVYLYLGHYNYVHVEWIPWFVLYFIQAIRHATRRPALLAGLCLALLLWQEPIQGLFVAIWVVIYLGIEGRPALRSRQTWQRLALIVLLSAVLSLPATLPTLIAIAQLEQAIPGWGGADFLVADLKGLFTPTILSTLWGEAARQATATFRDINTATLGYLPPLLALIAAWCYRRQVATWIVTALTGIVLALGPILHINGRWLFDLDGLEVTIPLPYILLHYTPIFRSMRAPNRFSILFTLAFAILAAYAIARFRFQVSRSTFHVPRFTFQASYRWRLVLIGLLIAGLIVEALPIPFPLQDARVPAVYETIAREPGDFAILSFPLGWRHSFGTLGAEQTQLQYYQSVHGKRLLNGNTSRLPAADLDYFRRLPVLSTLTDIELYQPVSPQQEAADRAAINDLIRFFDIRYIVLHPAIPGRKPYDDTQIATEAYVQKVFPLELVATEDGIRLFRVRPPATPADNAIQFGTSQARLAGLRGLDQDEVIADRPANWIVGREATLALRADRPAATTLILDLLPFAYPGAPPQQATVWVNGRQLTETPTLAPSWSRYQWLLPAGITRPGLNRVVVRFSQARAPAEVFPGNDDRRPLSAAISRAELQ